MPSIFQIAVDSGTSGDPEILKRAVFAADLQDQTVLVDLCKILSRGDQLPCNSILDVLKVRQEAETLTEIAGALSFSGAPQAKVWVEKCLDAACDAAGSDHAILDIATDYLHSDVYPPEKESIRDCIAAALVERLLKRNFWPAFYTAAHLYRQGIGVERNTAKARVYSVRFIIFATTEAKQIAGKIRQTYEDMSDSVTEEAQLSSEQLAPTLTLWKTQVSIIKEFTERVVAFFPGDEIKCLLAKGENQENEFKETLRWDVQNNRVNKNLEKAVLTAIVAMANAAGGNIFIGVKDGGQEIKGLKPDFDSFEDGCDIDKFHRTLVQLIQNHLTLIYPPPRVDFPTVGEGSICRIIVHRSDKPVFFINRSDELLIRAGPRTETKRDQKMIDYINLHWQHQNNRTQ